MIRRHTVLLFVSASPRSCPQENNKRAGVPQANPAATAACDSQLGSTPSKQTEPHQNIFFQVKLNISNGEPKLYDDVMGRLSVESGGFRRLYGHYHEIRQLLNGPVNEILLIEKHGGSVIKEERKFTVTGHLGRMGNREASQDKEEIASGRQVAPSFFDLSSMLSWCVAVDGVSNIESNKATDPFQDSSAQLHILLVLPFLPDLPECIELSNSEECQLRRAVVDLIYFPDLTLLVDDAAASPLSSIPLPQCSAIPICRMIDFHQLPSLVSLLCSTIKLKSSLEDSNCPRKGRNMLRIETPQSTLRRVKESYPDLLTVAYLLVAAKAQRMHKIGVFNTTKKLLFIPIIPELCIELQIVSSLPTAPDLFLFKVSEYLGTVGESTSQQIISRLGSSLCLLDDSAEGCDNPDPIPPLSKGICGKTRIVTSLTTQRLLIDRAEFLTLLDKCCAIVNDASSLSTPVSQSEVSETKPQLQSKADSEMPSVVSGESKEHKYYHCQAVPRWIVPRPVDIKSVDAKFSSTRAPVFPLICKTRIGGGPDIAHLLGVAFSWSDVQSFDCKLPPILSRRRRRYLRGIAPAPLKPSLQKFPSGLGLGPILTPIKNELILQEYVRHHRNVAFKVFVLGDYVFVVEQASIPDLSTAEGEVWLKEASHEFESKNGKDRTGESCENKKSSEASTPPQATSGIKVFSSTQLKGSPSQSGLHRTTRVPPSHPPSFTCDAAVVQDALRSNASGVDDKSSTDRNYSLSGSSIDSTTRGSVGGQGHKAEIPPCDQAALQSFRLISPCGTQYETLASPPFSTGIDSTATSYLDPATICRLSGAIKQQLGSALFGFDVLLEDGAQNVAMVVDMNFFPSYTGVPKFPELFHEYLASPQS